MSIKVSGNNDKTSNLSQILLWFGASVSIAEIMTGVLIAPLGFLKGMTAILIGHVIGVLILFLVGIIGAESKLSAIESTRISFGKYGSYGFSVLNILQLTGWTAIMVINGSKAFDGVTKAVFHYQNEKLWCILIGIFIAAWIIIGLKNLSKINVVVVGVLFVFTVILGFIVFKNTAVFSSQEGTITFGTGVELSVAMCLSWLPVISDYTRTMKHEVSGTVCSVAAYGAGSTFMFAIGLEAAIYAGASDISAILLSAGFGIIALIIVFFSTVTTTFLDVYSAGVSSVNLNKKINDKIASLIVCGLGVVLAIFVPISQYENFLYLIGSVFSPLFAILLTDYFILKKKKIKDDWKIYFKNIVLWAAGVIGYQLLLPYNSPIGITLPLMVVIGILCVIMNGGIKRCPKKD